MNDKGEITHTNLLRITEKKDEINLTVLRKMDDKRMREMSNAINQMKKLNRDLWEFLPILEKHVATVD